MCATCGCGQTLQRPTADGAQRLELPRSAPSGGHTVPLELDLLAKNDRLAARNRAWFAAHDVVAVNVMSSPGSGKTTLLEHTIRRLRTQTARPVLVVEGDQETDRDAERIRAAGCRAIQINTGAGCHLDAEAVFGAVTALDPPDGALLLIENVGNLVCPALFDLGERLRVVVMSVTEGEDKPLKYPHMFRAASVLALNKVDLLPYLDFDVAACVGAARRVNPRLRVLEVSALRGDGLDAWCALLLERGGGPDDGRSATPAA